MVAGFHLIWTAYGWWLPNDPRGSSSHEIRVEKIADLGELHPGRKEVQPSRSELLDFFTASREVLAHEPLLFTADDIQFADAVRNLNSSDEEQTGVLSHGYNHRAVLTASPVLFHDQTAVFPR